MLDYPKKRKEREDKQKKFQIGNKTRKKKRKHEYIRQYIGTNIDIKLVELNGTVLFFLKNLRRFVGRLDGSIVGFFVGDLVGERVGGT